MPREHVIAIDPSKPLGEEPETGHNRWHEAIQPVAEVDPGDTVVYETRDAVAYAICSVTVDLHISQTVDVPNMLVTALLPLDIFV